MEKMGILATCKKFAPIFYVASYQMKTVTIGKLNMTLPAFTIAVLGALTGVYSLMNGNSAMGLGLMLFLFVQAYTINCAVVGHCDMWAWALAIVYILSAIMGRGLFSVPK